MQLFVWGDHRAHIVRHVPAPANRSLWRMTAKMSGEVRCVCNYPAIVSLIILNFYWDSLLFRGGPKFSLRNNCKRILSKETDSAESVHLSNLCSRHLPHIVHRERHMDAPIRGDRGDASKLANPPLCGRPHSNTCVRKEEIAVIESSVRLAVPKDPAKGQCMQRVCWV